jgi:hypothetical protein
MGWKTYGLQLLDGDDAIYFQHIATNPNAIFTHELKKFSGGAWLLRAPG